MFEMDAYVGVDVLALSFMKGEQPHAGFPEAAYSTLAENLARAGYRVVIIEQARSLIDTKELLLKRPAATASASQPALRRNPGCCVC